MSIERLTLHQIFSPAFPTGGFAYSHGLETLVATGRVTSAGDAQDWLSTWLAHGAGWTDAVIFAHAARGDAPAPLDELAIALAGSAERRRETALQGAAFAATMRHVWGLDLPDLAYPVAAGRAVHLLGLDPGQALEAALLSACSNFTGAAIRLVPLGQAQGQGILAALTPLCADRAAAALCATLDDLGGFAPAIDIASARHETLPVRLFRS
ncbi:urease accessory protein UreF [Roseivivax halodurans JCM 10272]|uniref:Urease accessory protein UreF n=1 Tax=Roseivivax halodurans JCM 10272 TaxID=1449350 RepID=X7EJA8_9RHOB|nr:urease accessory UreF family protein [Roseivivax halodurans]ETX15246.1 urease accessory protein UreF [Roseivivax halodurans JCM 10272]